MLLLGMLAWIAQSTGAPAPPPGLPPLPPGAFVLPEVVCPPSAEEEARLLALPFEAFDQHPVAGWRPYGLRGCYRDAARLIAKYADKAEGLGKIGVLRFHQVQMLAFAGDTGTALEVLEAVKRIDAQRNAETGWRLYVAGTEAFLRSSRKDLEARTAELAAFADTHGSTERAARANGNVLQGLLRCFGKPYRIAYSPPCVDRPPQRNQTP
jgi:hypothetical protein